MSTTNNNDPGIQVKVKNLLLFWKNSTTEFELKNWDNLSFPGTVAIPAKV